jgi:hypothetical protein
MTEAEWNACADPGLMLEFLRGKGSGRKLRLFAVACCRCVWPLLDSYSRKAVRRIERYADNRTYFWEMWGVWGVAREATKYAYWKTGNQTDWHVLMYQAIETLTTAKTNDAMIASGSILANISGQRSNRGISRHAGVLRCVFGSLHFRAVAVSIVCLTPAVTRLAEAIYEERAFERMPVLGDALEEAGCDNASILEHCRSGQEHAGGCWVVDLLLAKG